MWQRFNVQAWRASDFNGYRTWHSPSWVDTISAFCLTQPAPHFGITTDLLKPISIASIFRDVTYETKVKHWSEPSLAYPDCCPKDSASIALKEYLENLSKIKAYEKRIFGLGSHASSIDEIGLLWTRSNCYCLFFFSFSNYLISYARWLSQYLN